LGGCGEKPIATIEMTCGTLEITAQVHQNRLDTFVNGQSVKMDQTISASGARYESQGTVMNGVALWNKGAEWLFFADPDSVPVSCVLKTIEAPTSSVK
jgi:membrane-bound inhibitor of C-type lysozyme